MQKNINDSASYDVEEILLEARRRREAQNEVSSAPVNPTNKSFKEPAPDKPINKMSPKEPVKSATTVLPKLTINQQGRPPFKEPQAPTTPFAPSRAESPKPTQWETRTAGQASNAARSQRATVNPAKVTSGVRESQFRSEGPVPARTASSHNNQPIGAKGKQPPASSPETGKPLYAKAPQHAPVTYKRESPPAQNASATSKLKTIGELLNSDDPLADGFKPWGTHHRRAPHALTPEEVLKTLDTELPGQAPKAESKPVKSEPASFSPPVNPFLQNRRMYDKTLHLEPAAPEVPCKTYKTPSGAEACLPVAQPTATLPKIRTSPPKNDFPTIDEIETIRHEDKINQRKRESFKNAVSKTESLRQEIPQPESKFYSTAKAEPAPAEPKDSFFITTPINVNEKNNGEAFLSRPQRDQKRALAKIRLFDGEEEENFPEEMPIFPDDESDIIDDFESMEDAPVIRADLAGRRRRNWLKVLSTGIFFGISAVITLLPSAGLSIPFINSANNYAIPLYINLVLLILAAAVNISSMKGLAALVSFKPDFDSSVALSTLLAVLHTAYLSFNASAAVQNKLYSYAAPAIFGLLLSGIGKLYMLSRVTENFEEVANITPKSAAFIIADENLAADAAADMTLGEPLICATRKTAHLKHFLYHSFSEDPADTLCSRLAPISFLAAALAFGSALILKQGMPVAVTAATAVICVFLPVTSLLAGHLQMFFASRRVKEEGGMLSGFDAVAEFCYTSSLAIDAKELFPDDNVVLHSIRTFGNLPIDQVIMDCAAVALASNSALSELFDKVIEGQRGILPKVQSLDYEDGCGISGVVSGREILVGNRELCQLRKIQNLPDTELESKILRGGKFPVYLASGGQLAAIFIVAYEPDEQISESLQNLADSGVSILISTSDPNITDKMVCKYFGLHPETVKVLPANISALLHKQTRPTKSASALISYKDTISAVAVAIRSCIRLRKNFSVLLVMQIVSICIGAAIGLYSLVANLALWSSVGVMLLYQAASVLVSLAIMAFRKP